MKRREFLSTTLAVAAAAGLAPRSARASNGLVEVLLDEPIGTIAPELQGHFTEHIGEVVYNGIWVGENSRIPNIGGIRKALVDNNRTPIQKALRYLATLNDKDIAGYAKSKNVSSVISTQAKRILLNKK